MTRANHAEGWQAHGATARGASHLRSGTPNQDAIGWIAPTAGLSRCAMVLSDGHGGKGHDLSHVGSRLAVECALAELAPLLAEGADADSALADAAAGLAGRIHARWMQRIGEWHGARDERALFRHGATLVAVALGDTRLLALQIGDGNILTGHGNGAVERVFPDDALAGEQTYSLCQADAPRFARHRLIDMRHGPAPVDFVMASTDGLMKSFPDDEGYRNLARAFRAQIAENGLGTVTQDLGDWLAAASASGSGDDISLGFLVAARPVRTGGIHRAQPPQQAEGPRSFGSRVMVPAASLFAGAALAASVLHGLGWLQPPAPGVLSHPATPQVQQPAAPVAGVEPGPAAPPASSMPKAGTGPSGRETALPAATPPAGAIDAETSGSAPAGTEAQPNKTDKSS